MITILLSAIGLAAEPAVPPMNAQLFHMSVDGRVGFGLDDATVQQDRSPSAKVAFHYVNDPLVYTYADGERVELLSDLFAVDVLGGWTLGRFRLGVDVPLYLAAMGDVSDGGVTFGDMGVDVKAVVLDPLDAPVGLAGVARVLLPTAGGVVPVGSSGVGVEVGLATSKEIGDWRFAANLTTRQIPETELENLDWGSHFAFRAGAAHAIGDTAGASVELSGAAVYGQSGPGSVPIEAMVGGWYAVQPSVIARLGAGTGLTDGIGAPMARMVASVSFEPGSDPDRDSDGLVDRVDACREIAEDRDEWQDTDGCPDPDDDQDGIADVSDACRHDPEDGDGWQDGDGCPDLDNDADGLADLLDRCPQDPEDADGWKDDDGCAEPTEVRVRFVDAGGKPVTTAKATFGTLLGGAEVTGTLAEGTYALAAEAPGYEAFTADLVVPPGPPLEVTRTLAAESTAGFLQLAVTDPSGKPLQALVRLDDGATSPVADGASLFLLGAGKHALYVMAEGHASVQLGATIDKGKTTELAVVMQPARVIVKKEALEIRDKIFFDTNKTTIRKQSHALLDEIAAVLRDHPEILKVSIEGHTDSRGDDAFNLRLSDGRAKAVLGYLMRKNIDAARLEFHGFGETRPLDPGETPAAWDKNRRVEFRIVSREPEEAEVRVVEHEPEP